MGKRTLKPLKQALSGEISIPGDKSISHRAIILASLSKGRTVVENFLTSEDCLRTIEIFRQLGVDIEIDQKKVTIDSQGFEAFHEAKEPMYFGNSGTTARLLTGLFASLSLFSSVYGDPYLTERPMDRVVDPLRQMGAKIIGRNGGSLLPLAIHGQALRGMTYEIPVKSAQVKSALLLAGLFAQGPTVLIEQAETRDHTERMLQAFGVNLQTEGLKITIEPTNELKSTDLYVPGDISSAAFFLVAGAIVPDSKIKLKNVGLNETRTGIIDVLRQMQADIELDHIQVKNEEPFGDITVNYGPLKGVNIEGDMIPRLIDEIPIIALMATQAEGKTVIKDAAELRVKETDRIKAVVEVLSAMGADIVERKDGMEINGPTPLKGAKVSAYYDHRIAMMVAIASLISSSEVVLDDDSSIDISYPHFFTDLEKLTT